MSTKNAQNSVHNTPPHARAQLTDDLPTVFRSRLVRSLEQSKFSSWRQVAKTSGCSPSLLQSIARGEYDNSNKGPGIFGAFRAAQAMDVSLDDLAPPNKRPSAARFLSTYRGFATPIHHFRDMLAYCDVYDEPRRGLTHIARLGPRSLLSERSGISDPALLQIQFARWPTARRKRIFQRQRRAWDAGVLTELEFFDVTFNHTDRDVQVAFILSACRVVDFDGVKRLLVFCEPVAHEY